MHSDLFQTQLEKIINYDVVLVYENENSPPLFTFLCIMTHMFVDISILYIFIYLEYRSKIKKIKYISTKILISNIIMMLFLFMKMKKVRLCLLFFVL